MRFDVIDSVLELNISGLQPDTKYSVQVAALTRKGDGDRSAPVSVKTPGGVPNRPGLTLKYVKLLCNYSPKVTNLFLFQGYRTRAYRYHRT